MLILRYLHCKLALFFSEMGWGIGILMINDTVRRATFQYNLAKMSCKQQKTKRIEQEQKAMPSAFFCNV